METPEQEHYTTTHDDWTDFTTAFKKWWSKSGPQTVLILLLGALSYMGVGYLRGRQLSQMNLAYTALDLATSPGGKVAVAEKYASMPGLVSNAFLDAGQMYLSEVVYGAPGTAGVQAALSAEDQVTNLEKAAKYYNRVIELKHTPLSVINGRLGLAAVLESQGQFDGARSEYEQVVELGAESYGNYAALAESRIGDLDRIAKKVTFPETVVIETGGKDFAAEAAALGLDLPGFNVAPAAGTIPLAPVTEEAALETTEEAATEPKPE